MKWIEDVLVGFSLFAVSGLFGFGTYLVFTIAIPFGPFVSILLKLWFSLAITIPATIVFAWIGHLVLTNSN